MKSKHVRKILLLLAITILLVGLASAATNIKTSTNKNTKIIKDNTKSIKSTPAKTKKTSRKTVTNNKTQTNKVKVEVAVGEKSTPTMDVEKNTAEQKTNKITREEKTLKASSSYNVETYQELYDALTNLNDKSITVNIKDNIKLEGNILLRPNINDGSYTYVTINGEGKTIDGDHKNYFLNIAQWIEVKINNLTINNCTAAPSLIDGSQLTAGGAIRNRDTLILNNTQFNNNNAELFGGAIWNYDTLIVDNTEFNNNTAHADNLGSNNGVGQGGAIYGGSVIVNNTRFNNNKADGGGAIFMNSGHLTVDNTEFNNNAATYGGAIETSGTSTVTNTVFNNNIADRSGGAIGNGGTLIVNNTLFNNNTAHGLCIKDDEIIGGYVMSGGYGGAISNGGTGNLTVTNSVFNNNRADNFGGAIETTAYSNLSVSKTRFNNNSADWWGGAIYYSNASESAGLGEFHPHGLGSYSITDTIFYKNTPENFIINQNNYIELVENANYLNVSNIVLIVDGKEIYNGPLYFDIGGYAPDLQAYCDVSDGNHLVKLIVNGTNIINNEYVLSDTIDVTYPGLIDTIEESTTDITIILEEGSYNIQKTIILDKPGITITIDGNGQSINGNQKQVFRINSGSTLVLKNITITNAKAEEGGSIYNEGTLIIINSTLSNNKAAKGGAIYNKGNLTITHSTLNNNTATTAPTEDFEVVFVYGGAIYNLYGNLTITDSTLINNQATATGEDVTANAEGGAIYNNYGNLTVTDSTLTNNTATTTVTGNRDVEAYAYGGAIYNTGTLTIINSTLKNNQLTVTATITTEEFITVRAYAIGGAIHNDYGTLNITNSTLENNKATVTATGFDATVDASARGGAIYNLEESIIIYNSTFNNNTAYQGETLYNYCGNITIYFSTFNNKTAEYAEEAITNREGNILIFKIPTTITLNTPHSTYINDQTIITGTLKDMNQEPIRNAEITININNQKISTTNTNENGTYTYTYRYDTEGNYTITVQYEETILYEESNNKTNTQVIKKATSLSINVDSITYVDNVYTVNGILKDVTGNTLSNAKLLLYVNDKNIANLTTDNNGEYAYSYKPTKDGLTTLKIEYTGSYSYLANTTQTTMTVKKTATKISLTTDNTTPYTDQKVKITITLSDINNKKLANRKVTVKVGSNTYTTNTNNNGIATVNHKVSTTGDITITSYYAGDNVYASSTANSKITGKAKIKTVFTIKVNDTKPYIGSSIKATITLKDKKGNILKNKKVNVKIGTKTYTSTTNSKGIVTVTYKTTKTGTIKVTASYAGETAYTTATKTSNVKVLPKVKTKVTLKFSKSKVKVKDKIKITVTLKNNKNKAIKNEKVAIKIGSKTYNKKTNSKGVITFNYRVLKSALGKAVTATYKGNYMYLNSKATKKLVKA